MKYREKKNERKKKTPTIKITPTSIPFAICLKSTNYKRRAVADAAKERKIISQ